MVHTAPRIDAHQHFWDPARGDYVWLTPDLTQLYRTFGPADLAPHLAAHHLDASVLVQAAPTLAETRYMLAIADASPAVAGVVGWIDFEQPGQIADLRRFASHPKFKGVRPMIQDIADPQWMLRPRLDWAFRALIDLDLTFDALVRPPQLPHLPDLLARYPTLRVVIDHGAKPDIARRAFGPWAQTMASLARDTQAFVKLSGLVTEAGANWSAADLAPYIGHLLATFGPQRMIYGSDWPVCLLAGSYAQWMAMAEAATAHLPDADRAAIFGGNAVRAYRL